VLLVSSLPLMSSRGGEKKKRNQTGVCVVAVALEEDLLMSFHIFEF
jgi:hypothetical protein